MILKVGVCDDDEQSVLTVREYLRAYEMHYDVDFEIDIFTSGKSILDQYHTGTFYHVLFLDVEMPELNGIELAKTLREQNEDIVKIVFVSSYPEYMKDSFDVHAYHYLQKPLSYETFQRVMGNIVKDFDRSAVTKLVVQENHSEELVALRDILYIQTLDAKKQLLSVVLSDRRLTVSGVLTEWENNLASHHFISPHRGFLVNLEHVHFIRDRFLILHNNDKIPLSRRHEKKIRDRIAHNLLTLDGGNNRGF